ncbi:MAG: ParA family protein [Aggregatilineales bacterium]
MLNTKVLTLLNEKGGVGKTTVSIHVAAGLAARGYRVILIDADPQGSATSALGMKKYDGLMRLVAQDEEWGKTTAELDPVKWARDGQAKGRLFLMPGHRNSIAIPMLLGDNMMILRDRIEDVEADVVIIDTSPTPSPVHALAYLASDYILFPTEAAFLSLDGLASSTHSMVRGNQARKANGLDAINLLGIQPMKVRPRTLNHKDNLKNVRRHFGIDMVWQPIMNRIVWEDATSAGRTIFAYQPERSQFDAQNMAIAEMNRTIEKARRGMGL